MKRFKPIIANNVSFYVTDNLHTVKTCGGLYRQIRENSKVLKIDCATTIDVIEEVRNVTEYFCMSTNESTKVTGSKKLGSFDIGVFANDDAGQRYIIDAFDNKKSFLFIIEMRYNESSYYYYYMRAYASSRRRAFPTNELVSFVSTIDRITHIENCVITFEYCVIDDYHSGSATYGYLKGSFGEYFQTSNRNYPEIYSQTYTAPDEDWIIKFGDAGDEEIPNVPDILVQTNSGYFFIINWDNMNRDYRGKPSNFISERMSHYEEKCCYSLSLLPAEIIRYTSFQPVVL